VTLSALRAAIRLSSRIILEIKAREDIANARSSRDVESVLISPPPSVMAKARVLREEEMYEEAFSDVERLFVN